MDKLIRNKIQSTAIITDIRNFSSTFKTFQGNESSEFLDFLENYYACQNDLIHILSNEVHMSSTGDGILAIFMDYDHHKNGYAYMLASHRALTTLCTDFVKVNPDSNISFGMGGDTGNIWNIGSGLLNTYVGTVINRASRIEATTKLFANTTTAVGNTLYKKLVNDKYPDIYKIMETHTRYDTLLNEKPETVLISKEFMLQYVFDMALKGIQPNAPIFRMSDTLINNDDKYWGVMASLISDTKISKIKELLSK